MLFINYILFTCYLASVSVDLGVLVSLVLSYLLTGISAFLVNDFYDQEIDLIAGKPNLTVKTNSYVIGFLVFLGFAVSFVLIQRTSLPGSYLLLGQFLALLVYSHPSVRLKTKPILGVIADSVYAYIIPVLLLLVVYEIDVAEPKYLTFLLFNFSIGIRDIILHQKEDEMNDLKSGINSFAIRYKTKLRTVVIISEFSASFSLCLFLLISFWKLENQNYLWGIVAAYLVILLLQIFKTQKSIENNYLLRFYVVVTSSIIALWIINENKYHYLILLIHPYFLQFFIEFFIWVKDLVAVIVNYLLYYTYKLAGRNLKEKPLYTRHDKKSSN
tara:strand:+ start:942 stop:1928 length:987 start_codon:yes stop_codon:yes gene_type:complete